MKWFVRAQFLISKVDPYLSMSNTVICVVYVDYCLLWERSQSDIDNVMKYFKEDAQLQFRTPKERISVWVIGI